MPGTIAGVGNKTVNKTKSLPSWNLFILEGEKTQRNKPVIYGATDAK